MVGESVGSNIKRWNLGKTEIAYNLEKTATTTSSTEAPEWKLYIPKIMPMITMGLPKETTVQLPASPFINDKGCKPVINSTIKSRNYLLASRPANCSFAYARKRHGIELEVEVLHENLDNLRITNTIDNSTPN